MGNNYGKIISILEKYGREYDFKIDFRDDYEEEYFGIYLSSIWRWSYIVDSNTIYRNGAYYRKDSGDFIYQVDGETQIDRRLEKYFKEKIKFKDIDWYKFMEDNNIYITIDLYLVGRTGTGIEGIDQLPKEVSDKILKEISSYYNHKHIKFSFID